MLSYFVWPKNEKHTCGAATFKTQITKIHQNNMKFKAKLKQKKTGLFLKEVSSTSNFKSTSIEFVYFQWSVATV